MPEDERDFGDIVDAKAQDLAQVVRTLARECIEETPGDDEEVAESDVALVAILLLNYTSLHVLREAF